MYLSVMGVLWQLLLLLFAIYIHIQVISCKGQVTLNLIKYDNPSNKDASDGLCDGFSSDLCDPLFKICYRALPSTKSSCPYETGHYDNNNHITFGDKIGGNTKNPMTFTFDHFDTALSLEVSVDDFDKGFFFGANDHIETVSHDFKTANSFSSHTPGTLLTLKGSRVSIQITVLVQCDDHYYGAGCGVYCRAQDAPTHYTCSLTGQKTCLSHWRGTDCDKWNYCHNHTCQTGATCINEKTVYTCSCPTGYTGSRCEIAPKTTTTTPTTATTTTTSTHFTTTTTKIPTSTTPTTTTSSTTTTTTLPTTTTTAITATTSTSSKTISSATTTQTSTRPASPITTSTKKSTSETSTSMKTSHVTRLILLTNPILLSTTKPKTYHNGLSISDLTLPIIMATGGVVALCSCVLMSAVMYKRCKKKTVKPRPLPKARYNFSRAPPIQRHWI